jgi:hypothetical protein
MSICAIAKGTAIQFHTGIWIVEQVFLRHHPVEDEWYVMLELIQPQPKRPPKSELIPFKNVDKMISRGVATLLGTKRVWKKHEFQNRS